MSHKTALFINFSKEAFTGYWDGKAHQFKSGDSKYMPDYLAQHFATGLTNRELQRTDESGNLIYKDGEKMTSPKKPEQVPLFMKLFKQAYQPEEEEESGEKSELEVEIDSLNKNEDKENNQKGEHTNNLPENSDEEQFDKEPPAPKAVELKDNE